MNLARGRSSHNSLALHSKERRRKEEKDGSQLCWSMGRISTFEKMRWEDYHENEAFPASY